MRRATSKQGQVYHLMRGKIILCLLMLALILLTSLAKQWCKALKWVHGISEKEGPEATASLSFPDIHSWAFILFGCQSACD